MLLGLPNESTVSVFERCPLYREWSYLKSLHSVQNIMSNDNLEISTSCQGRLLCVGTTTVFDLFCTDKTVSLKNVNGMTVLTDHTCRYRCLTDKWTIFRHLFEKLSVWRFYGNIWDFCNCTGIWEFLTVPLLNEKRLPVFVFHTIESPQHV